MEGPEILPSEIREALRNMKRNKAAGPDGIGMEMIEALGDYGVEKLTEVVNKIYDVTCLVPAASYVVLVLVIIFLYPLSKKRVESNTAELRRRRATK